MATAAPDIQVPPPVDNIIDGKAIAAKTQADLRTQVEDLKEKHGMTVGLGVLMVGERKDSQTYVRMKKRAAEAAGVHIAVITLPAESTQLEIISAVDALVADSHIHGVLVQLPLPEHVDEAAVLRQVPVEKDVDGFSATNVGNLCLRGGDPPLAVPCTPAGCIELIQQSGIDCTGKHAVVIGRSNIVGMPMAHLLLSMDATVTVCHSRTKNIEAFVRSADIVVAAVGRPKYVKADWLKPGAVVIDVGINAVPDATRKSGYRLVGDVDFEEAVKVAGKITPVPGGVGPMTIAMLLRNTVALARHALGLPRMRLRAESVHARDRDEDVQQHLAPVTVRERSTSQS